MNEQLKIKLTDQIQKTLNRNCYQKCKSVKNSECLDTCYEKYIRTTASVNKAIKRLSYQKHSLFGYKGYPQPSIDSAYYYDNTILVNLIGRAPMSFNRDYSA